MLPSAEHILEDVLRALSEDVGSGDLTASLIDDDRVVTAQVISRETAVLAGCSWFTTVFQQIDSTVELEWLADDGDAIAPDQVVCRLQGAASSILTAERTALNFLQTLSATASRAREYVLAVQGTGVRILDTRKTLPGLRLAQKYAVTCGGASNHRIGLFDAILIKENHIAAAGSVSAALARAQTAGSEIPVEVEVESLDELGEALQAGAKRILLDNFSLQQLAEAVGINQGRARLEASGGVTLDSIRGIAATGVDDISVGTLTKDIKAIDFSMGFVSE